MLGGLPGRDDRAAASRRPVSRGANAPRTCSRDPARERNDVTAEGRTNRPMTLNALMPESSQLLARLSRAVLEVVRVGTAEPGLEGDDVAEARRSRTRRTRWPRAPPGRTAVWKITSTAGVADNIRSASSRRSAAGFSSRIGTSSSHARTAPTTAAWEAVGVATTTRSAPADQRVAEIPANAQRLPAERGDDLRPRVDADHARDGVDVLERPQV